MCIFKHFKRVDISALLPGLKGPLSRHLPTLSIAEANKEVLKAVAEDKVPQKEGPYTVHKSDSRYVHLCNQEPMSRQR